MTLRIQDSQSLIRALQQLEVNCTTCDHFDQRDDTCKKYNVRPPARVIVEGCADHEEKLPF